MSTAFLKLCYGSFSEIGGERGMSKLHEEEAVADVTGLWYLKEKVNSCLDAVVGEKQMERVKNGELKFFPLMFSLQNEPDKIYDSISCAFYTGTYGIDENKAIAYDNVIQVRFLSEDEEYLVYSSGKIISVTNEGREDISPLQGWAIDMDQYLNILENPEDMAVRTWIVENGKRTV